MLTCEVPTHATQTLSETSLRSADLRQTICDQKTKFNQANLEDAKIDLDHENRSIFFPKGR